MGESVENATILVVDDEPALLKANEYILEESFDVITATDGMEALELVDDSIDVVLLDRRMPGMSGDEVLSELRTRGFEMPIGLVSRIEPDSDILDLRLDDYLTKPVDSDHLKDSTELLVARKELDDESRELLRLVAKKTMLKATDNVDVDSEPFHELLARIETLQANRDVDIDTLFEKYRTESLDSETLLSIVQDSCVPS